MSPPSVNSPATAKKGPLSAVKARLKVIPPDRSSGSTLFDIVASADGRSYVRGSLTFVTARRAREAGMKSFKSCNASAHEVDCSGITASDSAGLTVLLDWLALAKRKGCGLRYVNLPENLLAIARISDVDELLKQGVTGTPGAGVPGIGTPASA